MKKTLSLLCLILLFNGHRSAPAIVETPFNEGQKEVLATQQWPKFLRVVDAKGKTHLLRDFIQQGSSMVQATERAKVYRLNWQGKPHYLVVPQFANPTGDLAYVPTLQTAKSILKLAGVTPQDLPLSQDYYSVQQISDLNGDTVPDIVIQGNTGASSYNTDTTIIWSSKTGPRVQRLFQFAKLYQQGNIPFLAMSSPIADSQSLSHADWIHWTDLYAWKGDRFVKSNALFKPYFQNYALPQYQQALQKVGKAQDKESQLKKQVLRKALQDVQALLQ